MIIKKKVVRFCQKEYVDFMKNTGFLPICGAQGLWMWSPLAGQKPPSYEENIREPAKSPQKLKNQENTKKMLEF